MSNRTATNWVRAGFAAWLTFELLNWVGILHFTLDFSWLGLFLTVTVLWVAIEIVSWRLRKAGLESLPWPAYLAGLIGTSWDALGDVARLYTRIYHYDKIAHFMGGGAAALVVFFLYRQLQRSGKLQLPPPLVAFLAICTANFIGVLYELEEFSETYTLKNNRMGDAFDTSTDVLFNLLGAITLVSIVAYVLYRKKRTSLPPHV